LSGGEATSRRPAHLALARAVLIAPFGGAASVLGQAATDAAKGFTPELSYTGANGVSVAAMLTCYLLVEELARGRTRARALALVVAFTVVHVLLLFAVVSALQQHLAHGTSHRGGWPLLDIWAAVVDELRHTYAGGNLRVPIFLTGSPLLALGVARGVLQLPGWAQPLVVVAAALAGGALFGASLSSAAGYPRETWAGVIASSTVLMVPPWAAVPLGLRVGDRVAPWAIARVTAARASASAR
jgi:hypothetical protein